MFATKAHNPSAPADRINGIQSRRALRVSALGRVVTKEGAQSVKASTTRDGSRQERVEIFRQHQTRRLEEGRRIDAGDAAGEIAREETLVDWTIST